MVSIRLCKRQKSHGWCLELFTVYLRELQSTRRQLAFGVGHVFVKTGFKIALWYLPQHQSALEPADLPLGTLLVSHTYRV